MVDLRAETEMNSNYIRNEGYHLVETWECEWRELKKSNNEVKRFFQAQSVNDHWTVTGS